MRRARFRERGGVYVVVLVTVAIVAAMLVGSLDVVRSRSSEGDVLGDSVQAWHHAESAIEYGTHLIATEPTWRWTRGDGAWETDMPFGSGEISLEVTGADGSTLTEDAWQAVRITAIGTHGRARAILSVDLGMISESYPEAGAVLFANDATGYWPFADSAYKAELVTNNQPSLESDPAYLHEGAVPGIGPAAAPFFDRASLEIPYRSAYDRTRTISVWINPADVSTFRCIVVRDDSGYANGCWGIWVAAGELRAAFESSSAVARLDAPIAAGEWRHVVLVAESSRAVLYLDGVEVDTGALLTASYWVHSRGREVYVGEALSSSGSGMLDGSSPYVGSLCELALMGDPLTATEVLALYNSYPAPAAYKILADSWDREVR